MRTCHPQFLVSLLRGGEDSCTYHLRRAVERCYHLRHAVAAALARYSTTPNLGGNISRIHVDYYAPPNLPMQNFVRQRGHLDECRNMHHLIEYVRRDRLHDSAPHLTPPF